MIDLPSKRRRTDLSDPVGHYWKSRCRIWSDAWVFSNMTPEDREGVASVCWFHAHFGLDGMISCLCREPHKRLPFLEVPKRGGSTKTLSRCAEEYLCEWLAAFILIPQGVDMKGPDEELANFYQVEEGAVRFRRLVGMQAWVMGIEP